MRKIVLIPGGCRAGLAKQRTIGAFQTNSIQTELFQCRKA